MQKLGPATADEIADQIKDELKTSGNLSASSAFAILAGRKSVSRLSVQPFDPGVNSKTALRRTRRGFFSLSQSAGEFNLRVPNNG